MIFDALSNAAYMAQEPRQRGGLNTHPYQVVENLEAQQGGG